MRSSVALLLVAFLLLAGRAVGQEEGSGEEEGSAAAEAEAEAAPEAEAEAPEAEAEAPEAEVRVARFNTALTEYGPHLDFVIVLFLLIVS